MADPTPEQLIRILRADNRALADKVRELKAAGARMYLELAGLGAAEDATDGWSRACAPARLQG